MENSKINKAVGYMLLKDKFENAVRSIDKQDILYLNRLLHLLKFDIDKFKTFVFDKSQLSKGEYPFGVGEYESLQKFNKLLCVLASLAIHSVDIKAEFDNDIYNALIRWRKHYEVIDQASKSSKFSEFEKEKIKYRNDHASDHLYYIDYSSTDTKNVYINLDFTPKKPEIPDDLDEDGNVIYY